MAKPYRILSLCCSVFLKLEKCCPNWNSRHSWWDLDHATR